jgi:hypothetical protein
MQVISSDTQRQANIMDGTKEQSSVCKSVQIAQACGYLNALQSHREQPKWIANSKLPVLIGGHVGFAMAYLLGLFTIFRVAKAYKNLELKVCLSMGERGGLELASSCIERFCVQENSQGA